MVYMKKNGIHKLILCLLVVSFLIAVSAAVSRAGTVEPLLLNTLQSLSSNNEIPVIIHLSDKARLDLIQDRDKRILRRKILRALREKADTTQGGINAFLGNRNGKRIRNLWVINGIAVSVPAAAVAEIAAFPGVESVALDDSITPPEVTYSSAALPEWNISAVHATDLWNQGHTGAGAVVASMDSGVDVNHPDLQNKWRGGTNSWYDPNGQHATPYDAIGHGTQTMGIMVGGDAGGTSIGVAPGAQWIAVKIFNDSGTASYSAIHQGFQWLLDPDNDPNTDDAPDVVNNSWGLDTVSCFTEFQADIQVLQGSDIAVVFAAGNYGPSPSTIVSPANNAGSFAVGATDSANLIAPFSSRGPSACGGGISPHVTAPGVNIRSSDLTAGGVSPDSYVYVSGTSFAAPHVAGAIALLLSAFPGATPEEIETALKQSAADFGAPGSDNEYGSGFINILNAYALLFNAPSRPVIEISPLSHDFGTAEINSISASRAFQIMNSGTADLSVGAITLTGANASDFRIVTDNCSGRIVLPQEACVFEAVFAPASSGTKSASIVIPSNDPDHPSVSIPLTATGVLLPLRVTSPNGGERWLAGTTAVIRWSYTGNPGSLVKIELLRGGLLNRTIATYATAGSGGSGSYSWKIAANQTPDTTYQIRVKSATNSSYTDMSNAYFTISAPPPPAITVATPNGDESWNAGTTQTIRWNYTGSPGSAVKIELFKAGQLNRTISSYASIGSNGSGAYTWVIPSTQPPGSDYTIKIKSTTNSAYTDASDAFFTINGPPPPSITVTAPNGGETWRKSSGQTIRWTYTGSAGTYVKIELLKNGIVNKTIIAYARMGSGGAGSYYWYIPYNQASGDYQIRITSTSYGAVSDTGDGVFFIP
jgi:hypothetical protein